MAKHVIIPDPQVRPGESTDYLTYAGRYIADKRPDTVVCLGDFADMPSLSSYDVGKKSFEGRRYKDDIEAVHRGMEALLHPIKELNKSLALKHEKRYKPRKVMLLGNHDDRINRAINSDPKLDGTISIEDLAYHKFGWEVHPYLEVVVIDGIAYSHYFPSGQLGRPITSARAILNKMHMSCVAGHQQGRDIAYGKTAAGKEITAIICGSYYPFDQEYLNPQTNNHWRGIIVLHDVRDGEADDMWVSLRYLERKYGKL